MKTYKTANAGIIKIEDSNDAIGKVLHFCDLCNKNYTDKKKCFGRDSDCDRVRQKILSDFAINR